MSLNYTILTPLSTPFSGKLTKYALRSTHVLISISESRLEAPDLPQFIEDPHFLNLNPLLYRPIFIHQQDTVLTVFRTRAASCPSPPSPRRRPLNLFFVVLDATVEPSFVLITHWNFKLYGIF
jgi:hypothetical protein